VEIITRQFGTITIDKDKVIKMPKGMPGFSENREYVLLDHDAIRPFHSYQSVDNPDLSFVIMDPFLVKHDYSVDIKSYLEEMAWEKEDEENLFLYVIINATDPDPKKITANLLGPLLINTKKNEGIQMVVTDRDYSHKHLVFAENDNAEKENAVK
jgi:flagellar assembly factor FliW